MIGAGSGAGVLAAVSVLLTAGVLPAQELAAGGITKTGAFLTGAGFLVVLILIGVAAILVALYLLRRSRR